MPNWCYNTLEIEGDKEELKRFIEFAKTDDNDLDTEKFIPYPQKFKIMDKEDSNKSFNLNRYDDKDKELLVDGLNGYDWACKNWGTKWGICSASLNTTIEQLEKNEGQTVCYSFETAWSPPLPVILKMSEMFPKLHFHLEYEECGCDFEGDLECENGEVTLDDHRKYTHSCEECGLKDVSVTYDEQDESTLCPKCRMTPLQKIVDEKLESIKK